MNKKSLLLLALAAAVAIPSCQGNGQPARYHGFTGFRNNFHAVPPTADLYAGSSTAKVQTQTPATPAPAAPQN